MSELSFKDAVAILASGNPVSLEDSFKMSKLCSRYLHDEEAEHFGRDLVIRVLGAWERIDIQTRPIWEDLTEAYGLYPYINREDTSLSTDALLRLECHKSNYLEEIYLHEVQSKLSAVLQHRKSLVLSAPTSFGKSLLIEEVVASSMYDNIVVVQPTLALLDETRKKLSKYSKSYDIIISTSQEPTNDKGNIFLFTAERVVEYKSFPNVDFFVIDEFYKLSLQREDDRAITLNHAFLKLLRMTRRFYLLGPMIKSIPEEFLRKFEMVWFSTDFSTVAVDEVSVNYNTQLKGQELKDEKRKQLFELLDNLDEPTMIYCSAPEKTTKLAMEYALHKLSASETPTQTVESTQAIIEWISENINGNWSLVDALKLQIGIHHGALPRHLSSSVVDSFNREELKYLFCTSTLIEGVNTSAKNIVLFDKKKGRKNIDFFDYKNIAGRSGRMSKHFVGTVYKLENEPPQLELDVDIPIITQKDAPIEILVGLEESELIDESKARLHDFSSLDTDLQEVLKHNSGMTIEGQLKIISSIESDLERFHSILAWTAYPEYEQLKAVLEMAWTNLKKPKENLAGIRSANHLTKTVFNYIQYKSIRRMISIDVEGEFWRTQIPDESSRIDDRTFFNLNVSRHWFNYKLPKWLMTISELQNYVFEKHGLSYGNYTFISSQIEHGFLPPSLAALIEYDIPNTAINKLKGILNADKTVAQLLLDLRNAEHHFENKGLLKYEIEKIKAATNTM